MKVKISEYIAQFVVDNGIRYNFTVPGGGAMHLNMAFGHQKGLTSIFVQHEQAAAIAAEAYQRVHNELPLVCCTTGPGGTNTLTGVLGAWLDSIPMLVISGQVRYAVTARGVGLPVRAIGDQEFDITKAVAAMTKYAVMISDPKTVKYHLQKALYLAKSGRPGPVWLDVPLDIQSGCIDTDDFISFDPEELAAEKTPPVSEDTARLILQKIREAKRPVFNAGNGIRIGGAYEEFLQVIEKLNIPVVTGFDSVDLIPDEHPLYAGKAGLLGTRSGNWAIQNSDLILSVGSRLGVRQVGYSRESWAREAFVIMVEIDKYELQKPTIHVELPVQADAKDFLSVLLKVLGSETLPPISSWISTCKDWQRNYPVVQPQHYEEKELANAYCFIKELSSRIQENRVTVTGNGTSCVVGCQGFIIKKGQRFILNSGAASMGYDLPAAIGACFADNKNEIVCLSGDGSIQMNLQELQTIVFHKLPIKIFVINNAGYHSMRQTEANLFPELSPVGIGPETGDLSFPDLKKICAAYGIPYIKVTKNSKMGDAIKKMLASKSFALCEIFVTKEQNFEPKSATRRLPDGTLVSPPLEDMAPFLPREELERIMKIPLWNPEKK